MRKRKIKEMRTNLSVRLVFVLLVLALGLDVFAGEQPEPEPESMLFMEIPMVVTASKAEQDIRKAPSVMTVITAAEIERAGHKTLEEVLQRVVGFYPKTSKDWAIVASRGIDADMNHQYLFLIDGHNINSINGWGARNQHILPLLYHVDRIEVIRGPGSTLWGSDAALGIINIITKEGAQIDGVHVSTNYSSEDKQRSHNILAGKEFEKGSYMVSATYFDSKGYGESGGNPNFLHSTGASGNNRSWQNWQDFSPSWEIYGKVRTGPWTLMARQLNWDEVYRRNAGGDARRNRLYDNTFIEISHLKELGDVTSLETKVFTDYIFKEVLPVSAQAARREVYEEKGYGAEVMLSTILAQKHNVVLGVRAVRTKVGPNKRYTNYDPVTHTSTPSLFTSSGVDRTWAVYAEDQFDITDKLTLIAGGRYDENDFRESKSKFLPRLGAIYAFSDAWTAKYLYNSGYMRPAVNQSKRLAGYVNATDGQSINSHDLQLAYTGEKTSVSITAFYLMVKDYITWQSTPKGYANISDGDSRGIEFEFRHKLNNSVSLYGNYAYALAEMDDVTSSTSPKYVNEHGEWNGMPHQLFNLGVDWLIKENLTFNLHGRGWKDAYVYAYDGDAGIDRYETFGTEFYLDANLLYRNVRSLPLDISLYCTNVLDSKIREPLYSEGWALSKGRSFGFRLTYKF